MDIREAIKSRHSVRKFKDTPIEDEMRAKLDELAKSVSEESGLTVQMVYDDPDCFKMIFAYGRFKNAVNYIAITANESLDDCDEKCGYYGEKMVLEAQMMGLNTCWVGGSYSKGKCKFEVPSGEKLICIIAIGYGENEGVKHKSKPVAKLCDVDEIDMPTWFKNGMVAAMMAPTALNQQKFFVSLVDGEAKITATSKGPFTKVDLGIVKYNFEAATGRKCK